MSQQTEKDFMHKKQKTDEEHNLEKHMAGEKLMHEKPRIEEELNHESKNALGDEVRTSSGVTNQLIEELLNN